MPPRGFGAFVPLLLLAACATPSSATSSAKSCSAERAAELPVVLERGFLLVPGALNHNRVFLVVDTGAQSSMVTPQAAVQFGLEHDGRRITTINGTGGQVKTLNARVTSFAVGQMEMLDRSMTVGPLPGLGGMNPPVAGLVGADYLSDYDLDLDLPHRKLTLYRMEHCGSDFAPWNHTGTAIPARRSHNDLVSLDVLVDGEPLVALFDSGARVSVIKVSAAQRLGVNSEVMARDPTIEGFGVDRNTVAGHIHQFAEVHIGPDVFRNLRIQVAPLAVANIDMLLGADYLGTRHLWLSYATHRIFLAPPGA